MSPTELHPLEAPRQRATNKNVTEHGFPYHRHSLEAGLNSPGATKVLAQQSDRCLWSRHLRICTVASPEAPTRGEKVSLLAPVTHRFAAFADTQALRRRSDARSASLRGRRLGGGLSLVIAKNSPPCDRNRKSVHFRLLSDGVTISRPYSTFGYKVLSCSRSIQASSRPLSPYNPSTFSNS